MDAAPRQRRLPIAVAASLLACLASGAAWSQPAQPGEAGVALPDVTVRGQAALAAPASVIEADTLREQRDTDTLGSALEAEPGIQATHFGAGASRPVIRGMDGARVQVLSNGATIQDASTISPDHMVVTDPMLAERIEVLRGPSALLHGAGAIGGVVNVIDERIPTAVPDKPTGRVGLRMGSGAHEKAGAFSLSGGAGQVALHVEGAARDADDYRVGKGWNSARVAGSAARGHTGSVGVSWIGSQGFIGLSATRQSARYGLPGHSHELENCHLHGLHLHCGTHGEAEEGHDHDHGHDHEGAEGVPRVQLGSNRYELRGEWRQPAAGIEAVRVRGGLTRYHHEEMEGGEVATSFVNRANDWRAEAEHAPLAGWRGVFGVEGSQRRFSALGEEAYVRPTVTQRQGLFWMEERDFGDMGVSATLRHDRQRVRAADGVDHHTVLPAASRKHDGTSLALSGNWRFAPGWRASLGLTLASRLPTAEELFARGMHMATSSYELGDDGLRPERSRNIDLGLHKTSGNTTIGVSVYHNRIGNYIYARTLDAVDGAQLLQYGQSDARFSGLELSASHRFDGRWLGAQWRASAWADMVHARLAGGGHVPRLAPARASLSLAAQWGQWGTALEWRLVKRQDKLAEFETTTAGYGLLNWRLNWRGPDGWQAWAQLNNLTNKLAYVHTSFIKDAAPLAGRSLVVGVSKAF